MEAYFVSTLLVALAEMGDRTQLLAIMLASRYRKPIPILLGILAATVANHSLAALAGFYLSSLLSSVWFKYRVAGCSSSWRSGRWFRTRKARTSPGRDTWGCS